MRVIQTDALKVPAITQFLRRYGYTKVNFFYSDELYGQSYGSAALSSLAANGIEVVNPEAEWALTEDILDNPSNFTHYAQSVVDSGVRPVLLFGQPNYKASIIDLLYDIGLRTDDVLLVEAFEVIYLKADDELHERRLSMITNSFSFDKSTFNGPNATRIKKLIFDFFGEAVDAIHCDYYDSCYLLLYTLKTMILRGKDYEDSGALNYQLRDTVFYGCTGRVSIDKDSNDRRDQDTDINNYIEVDGQYTKVKVMRFSITSTQLFADFDAPVWPGGKTTAPQLTRLNYGDCPFPEEYRYDFEDGVNLVLTLGLSYIGFTCLIAVLLLCSRRLKNSVEMMTSKVQVTFQDRLVLLLVIVDCLQYIGHGPLLKNNLDIFQTLVDYASGGILNAIDFKEGVYWIVLNSVLSMVLLWFIFCIFLWLKYTGKQFGSRIAILGEALMPLLGNALFLPITSVIFDVFVCEEAHGPVESELEYGDSFMLRDCNEDCWGGIHLRFAIAGTIALVLYHPVTVVTRPLWQELIPDMNVMTRQTFYLQKSIVEVVLVGIRRGLRSSHSLTHGVIYVFVILLHMTLCLIRKPFNYPRLNLWFSLSMFMTAVVGLVSLFEHNIDSFTQQGAFGVLLGVAAPLLGKG
jgi:hypothetical protein